MPDDFYERHEDDVRQRMAFLKSLDHPSVAKFFGGSTTMDQPSLVFPFAVFEPVDHCLSTVLHRITPEAKQSIIVSLADGMSYLASLPGATSRRPFIHSDELFVTGQGRLKILLDPFDVIEFGGGTMKSNQVITYSSQKPVR